MLGRKRCQCTQVPVTITIYTYITAVNICVRKEVTSKFEEEHEARLAAEAEVERLKKELERERAARFAAEAEVECLKGVNIKMAK